MLSGEESSAGIVKHGFEGAYPSLYSLLTDLARAVGAGKVCLVSPPGGAECLVFADSLSPEPFQPRAYEAGERDAAVDVPYGGRILGQLVVVDAPHELDRDKLSAFAHAAGYIMGHAADTAQMQQREWKALSEARRSGDELRAQRSFLTGTLDNFPGVLIVLGPPPDFRLVLANSRNIAMLPERFRQRGEQPIGKTIREITPFWSEQSQDLVNLLSKVYKTGEPVTFEQYEASSPETGTTYWNWLISPITAPGDEERRFLMVIAHDITDSVVSRKQAQAAAAEARARADELETIINQMADGVAIFNADGQMMKMNPAGERFIGRGPALGVDPGDFSDFYRIFTTNGEPVPSEELPSERARRGETVIGAQYLVRRADDEEIVISVSGAPLYDGHDNLNGSVIVYHDITQEKMIERLKDEFLSIVSHELRTPLTAIMGYSDLMLRGVHGALNEWQGRSLSAVRANATRLLHLINDLLDVSKLEMGAITLDAEPVNLADVVSRTITQTRVLAANAQVGLQNFLPQKALPPVMADETKLHQIIENLLTNAIKFTPPGGTIAFDAELSPLSAEDALISAGSETGAGASETTPQSVVVTVRDTGAGLEPDQLERIWDRFYQVDSTARRRSGGAGLGLAIVRSLVDLHGGRVWAESEGVNRGSKFSFSLPVAGTQAAERPATGSLPRTRTAQYKQSGAAAWSASGKSQGMVLVVDDDEDQREIVSQMLRMEGYDAVFAFDGEEAIELANTMLPTAIILDVLLPRADGWEVLHRLKQEPATASIPVLILSVVDQSGFGKRLGADEYLLKPLDAHKLRSSIRRVTGKETADEDGNSSKADRR